MDKLWAPWRINYLRQKKQKKCIFCRRGAKNGGKHAVFQTRYSICILNTFPYNNGHLMVLPRKHMPGMEGTVPAGDTLNDQSRIVID